MEISHLGTRQLILYTTIWGYLILNKLMTSALIHTAANSDNKDDLFFHYSTWAIILWLSELTQWHRVLINMTWMNYLLAWSTLWDTQMQLSMEKEFCLHFTQWDNKQINIFFKPKYSNCFHLNDIRMEKHAILHV